ncbi:DUF4340 domain-containing protein [Tuwongella immobilis]|uniref:DUF4340 domain-containing protein n=1 Tax=Tuwongella immobilis TaxID=692036 RepID=A0A6C2YWC2_9BACT|nr:DUF4340 domain-containing protein [Tuwongella immobilis]VIP05667.1 Uncharacterized protein OS=Candidatus Kuenenia stuttgartiensis GN=kuste3559 PE=4 SV=1: DUF4340: DUF4340: DUF4340: DUF4340: DUF4340: DUF4340: DUF4340: DUF4340: DUF4340 [Tuwongella immobilis]VTS08690.1 Uncharacterized protein OS=Candidatus Kuenenia stuttgartiensis GN=kuste3559 PE=4 SV=1: DUF4340: DUF4340: DUF4340: DUF4340: DUF4340: DUF4340: DUF4340: DUF4340: DUF4340 [Tuwongella immobilis]
MNWKTTFGLLFLVLLGGAWWWHGEEYAVQWGLKPAPETRPAGNSITILADELRPGNVGKIIVERGTDDRLELLAKPSEPFWALPGNWPVRPNEVRELVDLLTQLQSRFEPIPLIDDTVLAPYGLSAMQRPIRVTLSAGTATHVLLFGRPEAKAGENPFTRPTFLRINEEREILRLGPDVYSQLDHPPEYYRTRQLFPGFVRLRVNGLMLPPPPTPMNPNAPPPEPIASTVSTAKVLTSDRVVGIELSDSGTLTSLQRTAPTPTPQSVADATSADRDPAVPVSEIARVWELQSPVRDHVDPDALVGILEAIPEMWVEDFLPRSETQAADFAQKTGLDQPTRIIRIRFAGGDTRTLRIGSMSRVRTRKEAVPSDPMFPQPPGSVNEREIREPLYYAQLEDSAEIFEIRGDLFGKVFLPTERLRDAAVARISGKRIRSISIERPGQAPIVLNRTAADPTAKPPRVEDRWDVQSPFASLAETSRITEILDAINAMKTAPADRLMLPEQMPALASVVGGIAEQPAALLGLSPEQAIRVRIVEQINGTDQLTELAIGTMNPARNLLAVQQLGWPRISLTNSTMRSMISRDALAFRSRKVLDLAGERIVRVMVERTGGDRFRLDRGTGDRWQMTEPVQVPADTLTAGQLVGELERLEAVEYVIKNPTDSAIADCGLNQPTATLMLRAGDNRPEQTLRIGKPREGKPESFARLDNGDIFSLSQTSIATLTKESLKYRPLVLFSDGGAATQIVVQRPGMEQTTLATKVGQWKLTAPYVASVGQAAMEPLLKVIRESGIERWVEHQMPDGKPFGLDVNQEPLRVQVTVPGPTPEARPITQILLIGKPVEPGSPSRFARLESESSPGVFTVGGPLVAEVSRDPLEWLDRQLLTVDVAQIRELEVISPTGKLVLQRDGDRWIPQVQPTFAVDRPTVETVIRTLGNLQASKFAAFGPKTNFADFGLSNEQTPRQMLLKTAEKVIRISLGKQSMAGEQFIRIDDQPGVAVVAADVAADLKTNQLDFVDRSLFRFEALDLLEMTRREGATQLTLVNDPTGWKLTSPVTQKADGPVLDELAEALSKLRADRVVAIRPDDRKPFGLDPPVMTWTLAIGDRERIIRIGNPVQADAPNGERFAQVDDSPLVVVLPSLISARLAAPVSQFRDRTLATFVSADRVEITGRNRTRTFRQQAGTWKLTAPISTDAEDSALRELHDSMAKLRAESIVTDNATDLAAYGLDQPTTWKWYNGDKLVLSLLVGAREKIGAKGQEKEGYRVYAKLESGKTVVLLDAGLSVKLTSEYRKRALWESLDVAQAQVITLQLPSGTLQLRKTPSGWQNAMKPMESIDPDRVTDLLDTLADLKAEEFVRDEVKPNEEKLYGLESQSPQGVISVGTATRSVTLQLGRMAENASGKQRIYSRLPGQPAIVLLSERDTGLLMRRPADYRTSKE